MLFAWRRRPVRCCCCINRGAIESHADSTRLTHYRESGDRLPDYGIGRRAYFWRNFETGRCGFFRRQRSPEQARRHPIPPAKADSGRMEASLQGGKAKRAHQDRARWARRTEVGLVLLSQKVTYEGI